MSLGQIKHDINAGISERVNSLLRQYGMSQVKLCKEIKVPPTTLSGNLNNKAFWQLDTLIPISKFFNVSLDYLITGEINTDNETLKKEIEQLKTTAKTFQKTILELLKKQDETETVQP